MTQLLSAAQMKAIETEQIESGDVSGLELMEHAGAGVVRAVFEKWPELAQTAHRAVVLCGPGNNGGDGFVVARLLKQWGWQVSVYLFGNPDKLPPDAKTNYQRWVGMGTVQDFAEAPVIAGQADLFVDGLFGTGLIRPLQGKLLEWAQACAADPEIAAKTVAIDIPSGLCSDSGRKLAAQTETVRAALTVSFHRAKLGHVLNDGPDICGQLAVVDIGLSDRVPFKEPMVHWLSAADCSSLGKHGEGHKYDHGHALILAGRSGKGGAARLAARGALRIGAGLVTVAPTPGALQENAARLDAIMLSPVGDAPTLEAVLADKRFNALCLGPGLGQDRARDLVPVALASGRATVLDADALTAFQDDPAALFGMLHENCVLTPHAGEFARLFPDIADKLNAPATKGPAYSKVAATREAAARAGCVVLFKGPDTVIAAPDGRCSVHAAAYERSAPWLATAGAGDVLAGFITGLLARGQRPLDAAGIGAWLHVEAALAFGPGLIAEDLPEALPKLFTRLGN
ncbi:MAG: bifunctional ADP-dependent NAD(P)H-hydrate dehydratase/NAD(P)H-hydrate epimerase [Rhodobacterales bacterium]|nr:MAG: bifunctional ADP-dependent NAD(P)H-hydrate dehydratase/NAD(P)H-hydrate epimerase [Rhodobacterales bacterium]